jgi:hypothetical protein
MIALVGRAAGAAAVVFGLAMMTVAADEPQTAPAAAEPAVVEDDAAPEMKPTVAAARRQAKLLQKTYITTLQMMHRRYFDEDERHPIPARTLEEVFAEVDAGTERKTRWIAVNTPAMNVDHEPQPGFETAAVAALTEGKPDFEQVENGVYRRAGVVPLAGGCLKCHVSGLSKQVTQPKVAGFVIAIPVQGE